MGNSSHQTNSRNAAVGYDLTVTAASGTTSTTADLEGRTLVGIITPASLASTSLTIDVSDTDGGTYRTLVDKNSTEFVITVDSTTRQYYFEPVVMAGVRFLQIEFGTSETAKTVTLVTRPLL